MGNKKLIHDEELIKVFQFTRNHPEVTHIFMYIIHIYFRQIYFSSIYKFYWFKNIFKIR